MADTAPAVLSSGKQGQLFFPCRVELGHNRFNKSHHQGEVEPHVGHHQGHKMTGMLPSSRVR